MRFKRPQVRYADALVPRLRGGLIRSGRLRRIGIAHLRSLESHRSFSSRIGIAQAWALRRATAVSAAQRVRGGGRGMGDLLATMQALGPSRLLLIGSSRGDRKSTRLNSSHSQISYAVFCLK